MKSADLDNFSQLIKIAVNFIIINIIYIYYNINYVY